MQRTLRIVRGRMELGYISEQEARDLLEAGFLRPSDSYKTPGMRRPKPLSELPNPAAAARPPLLQKARRVVSSAGETLMTGVAGLGSTLKSLAPGPRLLPTHRFLHDFIPQIQRIVSKELFRQTAARTRSVVQDDKFMRKVFGAAYDCLPKPVHRFVTEQAFIEFCLTRREKFIVPGEHRELPKSPDSEGLHSSQG